MGELYKVLVKNAFELLDKSQNYINTIMLYGDKKDKLEIQLRVAKMNSDIIEFLKVTEE